MRRIVKQGDGGYQLRLAHSNPPVNASEATSRWGSFAYKCTVRDALIKEQFYLCCYSELRADEEGLGFHIEHIENKSQNPARTFDYSNLAISALDSACLGRLSQGESFGGHAAGKQRSCDMARLVSCHQPDCSRFFVYLSDGRIEPSNSLTPEEWDRSRYTIDLLNLDSPYLRNLRRRWWEELDQLFQEHEERAWSLDDLAAIDLIPTSGRLNRFFSMTRQFFGQIAERVLKQGAPQLL